MQQRIFKAGAEISAIKELELFVSPAGEKTLAADMDGPGGLDTYLYHIRKTMRGRLECILKVDVNCWNFFFSSLCIFDIFLK